MELNVAEALEAISARIPERECIVFRDRCIRWAELTERTRRLASYLHSRGLRVHRERSELGGSESGQDHVALYMYNGNAYIEGMLGAYKARLAPFNVNYRYVEEELVYLFKDARARAVIYHAELAPTLERVRGALPDLEVLIQVADGSGHPLLPGAVDYEDALASASPSPLGLALSPDDLYILYTGGTTGQPKGVLWRQADVAVGAFAVLRRAGVEYASLDEVVEAAAAVQPRRVLPAAPFMHGAAHWSVFANLFAGHTVVIQRHPERLDPDDLLTTVERDRVDTLLIVGDAFARPILDQMDAKSYDLRSLRLLITGGAALSAVNKAAFLERLPGLRIVDAIGSSESGAQGVQLTSDPKQTSTGTFDPAPGACILSEDMTRVLAPGHEGLGWFAKSGRVPLGYLDDPAKTARTFPLVDGVRYSVPGDRARQRANGVIEVRGRDSVTITSGGEKIFAEEVEHALKHHAAVYDTVVVGRPSERWGQEVVALVALRKGALVQVEELLDTCRSHIARYKVPKQVVFLDAIVRSPSGKADYRWAREQALAAAPRA